MTDQSGEYANAQAVAAGQSGEGTGGGCAACHLGNWVHVRYEYTDRSPVTDAVYVVQKPNNGAPGGEIIAEGPLTVTEGSGHSYVHVDLGDYDGEVEVYFYDDPDDVIPYEEPNPVTDQRGWFEKSVDYITETTKDGLTWVGGTLMGDFNEDMTSSQIIANTVVTMVPGIDQIGDARDLAAHAKMLIWDKRHNDPWVWVGVVACLIGLIPTLGSLAKGIVRLTFRNLGNIGEILILINRCANKLGFKINGVKTITKVADELVARSGDFVTQFQEYLDILSRRLTSTVGWVNRAAVAELARQIDIVKALAADKIPESAKYVADLLRKGLKEAASFVAKGQNRSAIIVRRVTEAVIEIKVFKTWKEFAEKFKRADFDPNAPDVGAVPIDLRKFEQDELVRKKELRALLPELKKELDALGPDNPFRNYSTGELYDVLRTFDGKPRLRNFEEDPCEIYRVVQSDYSAGGEFWSPRKPAQTEAEWRNGNAVLQEWNSADGYVKMKAPPPKYGIMGDIAAQRSKKHPDLLLEGGQPQIYFPKAGGPSAKYDTIAPFGSVSEIEAKMASDGGGDYRTPWNERHQSVALKGSVRAGTATECDK